MKKKIFYLAILAFLSLSAHADDYFKHGGIRYKIESFVDQELCVTYPDESDNTTTDLIIPATIRTRQGQVWTVTAIGAYAFDDGYGYKKLRSVTIPKTVKRIHEKAFSESHIEKLTVECAISVPFDHLKKTLTTLHLGQLAVFQGAPEEYFTQLYNLRTITASPQNKSFAVVDGVLYNKTKTVLLCVPLGISVLKMPATVERLAQHRIPSGKTSCNVFRHDVGKENKDIREVHFSPKVKEIPGSTFSGCENLKVVSLPSALEAIGDEAFFRAGIESITLPGTLKSIGNRSFECTKITKIDIPNSVQILGFNVFRTCNSLKEVTLPGSLTEIPNDLFSNCAALETISIPNSVTKIGMNAFMGCTNLKEVVMSTAVTEIGQRAFQETGLTQITLPSTLVSIGRETFYKSKLKEIKVPASVKEIDCYAFLVPDIVVYLYAVEPPSNDCSSINGIFNANILTSGFTLHIPKGSKENYLRSEPYKRCEGIMIDDL